MDDDHGSAGDVEWVGPEGDDEVLEIGSRGPRSWRRRTALIVLVLAGVVAAIVVSRTGRGTSPSAETPSPSSHTPPSYAAAVPTALPSDIEAAPTRWVPVPTSVDTEEVGRPILGITAGYELLARGPSALVRVQFAQGRVIMTGLPGLASTGPVSFVVGAQRAVIRPLDHVPGYAVADGGSIRSLGGLLADGGRAMPGPDGTHLWIAQGALGPSVIRLVDAAGRPGAASIRIPAGYELLGPDGAGYVLLRHNETLYDARPGRLNRIANGDLLATGPTGWLVRACASITHCTSTYVDRRTGSRHQLPKDVDTVGPLSWGVISPDGSTAALITNSRPHGPVMTLVDLPTGVEHPIPQLVLTSGPYTSQVVFSPDGRWLFLAGDALVAVDLHTRRVHTVSSVPADLALAQLAVRSTRTAG